MRKLEVKEDLNYQVEMGTIWLPEPPPIAITAKLESDLIQPRARYFPSLSFLSCRIKTAINSNNLLMGGYSMAYKAL